VDNGGTPPRRPRHRSRKIKCGKIPKGFQSSSPRLRGTSYLGSSSEQIHQP
jgi:hypothetical protein